MIKLAAGFLVLAGLVGVYMARRHFTERSLPWPLPAAHGLFVLAGLILFTFYLFSHNVSVVAWTAWGLFLFAAGGGLILLKVYLRKKPLPSGMIVIHGTVALVALILLAGFLYAQSVLQDPSDIKEEHIEDAFPAP